MGVTVSQQRRWPLSPDDVKVRIPLPPNRVYQKNKLIEKQVALRRFPWAMRAPPKQQAYNFHASPIGNIISIVVLLFT